MSHRSTRIVAVVASLALSGCSTVGTINDQRLDGGTAPPPARSYPCQDAEFLCIVAIGAIVGFAIAYSQDSEDLPTAATE